MPPFRFVVPYAYSYKSLFHWRLRVTTVGLGGFVPWLGTTALPFAHRDLSGFCSVCHFKVRMRKKKKKKIVVAA